MMNQQQMQQMQNVGQFNNQMNNNQMPNHNQFNPAQNNGVVNVNVANQNNRVDPNFQKANVVYQKLGAMAKPRRCRGRSENHVVYQQLCAMAKQDGRPGAMAGYLQQAQAQGMLNGQALNYLTLWMRKRADDSRALAEQAVTALDNAVIAGNQDAIGRLLKEKTDNFLKYVEKMLLLDQIGFTCYGRVGTYGAPDCSPTELAWGGLKSIVNAYAGILACLYYGCDSNQDINTFCQQQQGYVNQMQAVLGKLSYEPCAQNYQEWLDGMFSICRCAADSTGIIQTFCDQPQALQLYVSQLQEGSRQKKNLADQIYYQLSAMVNNPKMTVPQIQAYDQQMQGEAYFAARDRAGEMIKNRLNQCMNTVNQFPASVANDFDLNSCKQKVGKRDADLLKVIEKRLLLLEMQVSRRYLANVQELQDYTRNELELLRQDIEKALNNYRAELHALSGRQDLNDWRADRQGCLDNLGQWIEATRKQPNQIDNDGNASVDLLNRMRIAHQCMVAFCSPITNVFVKDQNAVQRAMQENFWPKSINNMGNNQMNNGNRQIQFNNNNGNMVPFNNHNNGNNQIRNNNGNRPIQFNNMNQFHPNQNQCFAVKK